MRGLASLLLVAALVVAAPGASADADPACGPWEMPQEIPGQGMICVPASDPGDAGGDEADPGAYPATSGGGSATCRDAGGKAIPCSLNGLAWFSNHTCYAGPVTPPAPSSDPFWPAGEGPDTGDQYHCQLQGDGTPFPDAALIFFVADGEAPAVLIDPAVLAQRAMDQMRLATPAIHTAPHPPDLTYVGLETWLWMDPGQWDTLELTVTAGATSVTVTAAPVRSTWDLTTGSTTCPSAGRAWADGMTNAAVTDCSYTWSETSDGQPQDAFSITATLTYQVDWTCSGACLTEAGTLGEVEGLPGAAAIRVGERQSVVIEGD
jgi:hypothetical protein